MDSLSQIGGTSVMCASQKRQEAVWLEPRRVTEGARGCGLVRAELMSD